MYALNGKNRLYLPFHRTKKGGRQGLMNTYRKGERI